MESKLRTLNLIFEKKDELFGRFTSTFTHQDKNNAWKHVFSSIQAIGISNIGKDWKSFRDVTWRNWRRRTLEKRDNRNQSGAPGGRKNKLDESDELILQIIVQKSQVVAGLAVPESSGTDAIDIFLPSVPPTQEIAATDEVTQSNSSRGRKKAKNYESMQHNGIETAKNGSGDT